MSGILDLFPFLGLQAGLGLVVLAFVGSGEPRGVVSSQAVPLLFSDPSFLDCFIMSAVPTMCRVLNASKSNGLPLKSVCSCLMIFHINSHNEFLLQGCGVE